MKKFNITKPICASNFMNVKSPNIYKINKNEFDYLTNEKKLYCDSCGHKSFIWAECDKYKDLDNESNQMLCPNCFSYNYFEGGYTLKTKKERTIE